jgi:hypothetical protein
MNIEMLLNRWQIATIFYIVFVIIIISVKPSMMFTAEGHVKSWSTYKSEESSVFSPIIVFPMMAIICYYLGIWIELLLIN